MAEKTDAASSGAAGSPSSDAGSAQSTGSAGSSPSTVAEPTQGASATPYSAKVAAARAKATEAKQPDPKGPAPAAEAGTTAADATGGTDTPQKSSAPASADEEHTKRVAELANAARNAREETARLKKEREAAAAEKAAAAKDREESKELISLASQLRKLRSEGKYAEAWALAMEDKAHDIDAFTQIAERVAGTDKTPTAADIQKLVEASVAEAKKKNEDAKEAEKKTKAAERAKDRERAESVYFDSDDPKELGVIPTYRKDPSKYPAIHAVGADRDFMRSVVRDEVKKTGQVPTAEQLLTAINARIQERIDREAKALGYAKPEPKKPPPAQRGGGAPTPTGKDRSEMSYSEKLAAARAGLRGS